MPTTFTHDVFGKSVYQKLPEDLKEIIRREMNAYRIGLHGPDIFFYYQPYRKNPVSQTGYDMHKAVASSFFRDCKKKYADTKNDTFLAYVIGFICHYMLDSTCHPYILDYMERTGTRHDEIETDLDRALMEINGKNPLRYQPARHLRAKIRTVKAISEAFDEINERQIYKSLRGARFYTGIFVFPNPVMRSLVMGGLRLSGLYKAVHGRIVLKEQDNRLEESTGKLIDMCRQAVGETVAVINDYWQTRNDLHYLNFRFERNYLEMKEA